MDSLNPYCTPTLVAAGHHDESGCLRHYLVRHFACFILSYLLCFILFYCVFAGPTKAIASLADEPQIWLVLTALGTAVWFVHACFVSLNRAMHRSGPTANAIVGAMGFMACALASQLISDFGPYSIAVPLSWTPEYLLISLYMAGSIVSVAILARVTRAFKTADTHPLHRSNGG